MPFKSLTLYTITLTSYYPPPIYNPTSSTPPPFTPPPPPITTPLASFSSKFKANKEFSAIFTEDYWDEAGKPPRLARDSNGLFKHEWTLFNPTVPVAPGDTSRLKGGGVYKREMRIEESVTRWNDDEPEEDANDVIELDADGLPKLQADELHGEKEAPLVAEQLRSREESGNGSGRKRALTDLLEREDGGKAMRFGEYARSFVKA